MKINTKTVITQLLEHTFIVTHKTSDMTQYESKTFAINADEDESKVLYFIQNWIDCHLERTYFSLERSHNRQLVGVLYTYLSRTGNVVVEAELMTPYALDINIPDEHTSKPLFTLIGENNTLTYRLIGIGGPNHKFIPVFGRAAITISRQKNADDSNEMLTVNLYCVVDNSSAIYS